jgi:hypothetical protein
MDFTIIFWPLLVIAFDGWTRVTDGDLTDVKRLPVIPAFLGMYL